jgi:hypothetical protein
VKWSINPAANIVKGRARRLLRLPQVNIEHVAAKSWEIAPGSMLTTMPSFYLPNQLERVTGRTYSYDWNDRPEDVPLEREVAGGIERYQAPTRAFLLKDAFLMDGSIHKAGFVSSLYPRSQRMPRLRAEVEVTRAAVYGTYDGNVFFGLWLTDDLALYPLAANEGLAITTDQTPYSHAAAYEKWLEMSPMRLGSAYFRELVLFDDRLQNQGKRERFASLRNKLTTRFGADPHPGVFIVRGSSGKARKLHNELELAERLRARRGFRVVDINADAETILSACAGARVLAGVEGSHLYHGLMVLAPGAAVLALQPPNRFCPVLKRTTDRDGQHYGFVIGLPRDDGFAVDPDEVERTIDLFP